MKENIFMPFFIRRSWQRLKKAMLLFSDFIKKLRRKLYLSWEKDKVWFLLKRVKSIESLKPAEAKVEVVSLVSHRDLLLFLTAIKTLFYFSKRKFLVTVFEDGSFTSHDIAVLKAFIHGVRFISLDKANHRLKKPLKDKQYCRRFRRDYLMARRIIDLVFLSRKERVLMLDSDLISFSKPVYFCRRK